MTTTTDRVLNACYHLNADAYQAQVLARGKKLKQFTPCLKAEALMLHIREGKHLGTCHAVALLTPCPCHQGMTDSQLLDYEFSDTHRQAHHNHDRRTLYPKLYSIH